MGLKNGADGDLVASGAEVFVPHFGEACDQFFRRAACDRPAGVHEVAPGGNTRTTLRHAFECDPLRKGDTHGVVNPAYAFAGNTTRNDVLDTRIKRLENFNLEPAARLPGKAFGPIDRAVDFCKRVPAAAVRKKVPT